MESTQQSTEQHMRNHPMIEDKLSDLNVKYEALEEKYNVVVLENDAYKLHIVDVVKENEDLKEEITNTPLINDADSLLPKFFDLVTSNATQMTVNEQQIEELKMSLDESIKTIASLESGNAELKDQNVKLQCKLEAEHEQKQIIEQKKCKLDKIQKSKLADLHDKIQKLYDQNNELHEQLNAIKKLSNHASNNGLPQSTLIHSMFSSISAGGTTSPLFGSRRMSLQMDEYVQYFDRNVVDDGYIASGDHDAEDIVHEYQDKLQQMEMENEALTQQLIKMHGCNNKCKGGQNEAMDDENDEVFAWNNQEPNVVDLFDDDDLNEMEQLFTKCDNELTICMAKQAKESACKSAMFEHMLQVLLHAPYK